MRKESGFTLIELLIVLAILGILVGIVAMSVGDLTNTAKQRGMEAEMQVIQTAIDTYNTQDVLVEGDAAIAAQGSWTKVGPTAGTGIVTPDFAVQYIKSTTKYYFQWAAAGEGLTVTDVITP